MTAPTELDEHALEANWKRFQDRARRVTRTAINRGILVRPCRCQKCGKLPSPRKDGKSAIQCHHPDYSDPLHVEWLCSPCHRAVTPVSRHGLGSMPGSSNSQAKLTEQAVSDIRKTYEQGVNGYRRLARQYGVSIPVIKRVVNGRGWTHVE